MWFMFMGMIKICNKVVLNNNYNQLMIDTSPVEISRPLAHALSIHRIFEFFSPEEQKNGPKARFALAKSPEIELSHQSRSTACRYLLQQLLSVTSATRENDWKLYHSTSGAPYLLRDGKPSTLNISLAHSSNWLAAGVTHKAQVGVDVEQFRPRRNFLKIANYLGWKNRVRDIHDFHAKWTLWEASAKCIQGSVMMTKNPGFELLCDVNTRDSVCNSGNWSGLHGCVNEESFYAIVLKCKNGSNFIHRTLETGKIEPW